MITPEEFTVEEFTVDSDTEYVIENGWLCEAVNYHTCGTARDGYYGAHEPGCGLIPIANIADPLDKIRAKEGERIAQAIESARDKLYPGLNEVNEFSLRGYTDAGGYTSAARIARQYGGV